MDIFYLHFWVTVHIFQCSFSQEKSSFFFLPPRKHNISSWTSSNPSLHEIVNTQMQGRVNRVFSFFKLESRKVPWVRKSCSRGKSDNKKSKKPASIDSDSDDDLLYFTFFFFTYRGAGCVIPGAIHQYCLGKLASDPRSLLPLLLMSFNFAPGVHRTYPLFLETFRYGFFKLMEFSGIMNLPR